uniref:Uncharacterized protein n=1 Tax=viral metagenome TaxID=1070528 RepID=A0A6H1ZV38_9ZZZZ
MELSDSTSPSIKRWDGVDLLEVFQGQKIKINITGAGGGQLLDVTVPAGKKWTGSIRVQFTEYNI